MAIYTVKPYDILGPNNYVCDIEQCVSLNFNGFYFWGRDIFTESRPLQLNCTNKVLLNNNRFLSNFWSLISHTVPLNLE